MEQEKDITGSEAKAPVNPQLLKLQQSLASGKSVIGIDIGYSSVNVAQTVMYKGKPTLIKVVVEEIGMVSDPEREQATIDAVEKALAGFNTKRADVVCTVSNQKSILDFVAMPLMPEGELADAVKFEVGSSERFSLQDPITDFILVGRIQDKGVEKLNVMVAAVAQEAIDQMLSRFQPLTNDALAGIKKMLFIQDYRGLNLSGVIPISIALEHVMQQSKSKEQEIIATLEMGSVAAEFNVYREGQLEFSRKINVTGLDFTRCLTSALFGATGKVELSMQEAEWLKKEYGIPKASEEFLIKDKITANQALSLLRPKLEQLIKEITRSFDFYYDKSRVGTINKLVLFGGGTLLKRLPEFLNAELGLPVGQGNPIKDVECLFEGVISSPEEAQRATLAIGASLRGVRGINLLPETARDSNKKLFQRALRAVGAVVFVLVSIALYGVMWLHLNLVKQESEGVKSHYQTMVPKLMKMKQYVTVQNLAQQRFNAAVFLRDLSHVPDKVYLKNVNMNAQGALNISGVVAGSAREAKKILAPWVAELKKGPLLEVKLQPVNEDASKQKSNFLIKAKVKFSGSAS